MGCPTLLSLDGSLLMCMIMNAQPESDLNFLKKRADDWKTTVHFHTFGFGGSFWTRPNECTSSLWFLVSCNIRLNPNAACVSRSVASYHAYRARVFFTSRRSIFALWRCFTTITPLLPGMHWYWSGLPVSGLFGFSSAYTNPKRAWMAACNTD